MKFEYVSSSRCGQQEYAKGFQPWQTVPGRLLLQTVSCSLVGSSSAPSGGNILDIRWFFIAVARTAPRVRWPVEPFFERAHPVSFTHALRIGFMRKPRRRRRRGSIHRSHSGVDQHGMRPVLDDNFLPARGFFCLIAQLAPAIGISHTRMPT